MNIIKWIPIVGLVLSASCGTKPTVLTNVISKAQGVEYKSTLEIDWTSMLKDTSSVLCNIQGVDYSAKNNALYLIQSDPELLGRQMYWTLKLDKTKSKIHHITSSDILSQNGQKILNTLEYKELIDKGKRPRYNVPLFNGIVYDDVNKMPIILNSGTNWVYGNALYSTEPSVHTLSEDNRLLGVYSLNRMFRPKVDSLLKEVQISAITMSPNDEKLFTVTALPLPGEKPSVDTYDTGFVRICKYRSSSRSEESQYLYPLILPNNPLVIGKSAKDWQIVSSVAVSDSVLWVLEGLQLNDLSWDYMMYEVVLRTQDKLTSSKPISELKKRPVLKKKKLSHLSNVFPDFTGEIKDMCLGPIVDKQQVLYILKKNYCSEEQSVELIQLIIK